VLIVSIHKAKSILSELAKRAESGEPVFIGRYGKPVAALVPVDSVRRVKRLGILAGKLTLPAGPEKQTGGLS
jgi:prevent-host-death family protein